MFFGHVYHIMAFCESWEARASSVDTNLTRRIDPRHAEGPQIPQLQGNMFFMFYFSTDSSRNSCVLLETVVSFQKQSYPSRNSRALPETFYFSGNSRGLSPSSGVGAFGPHKVPGALQLASGYKIVFLPKHNLLSC